MLKDLLINFLFLLIPSPTVWLLNNVKSKHPIEYTHYRMQAMKQGHLPPTPKQCEDGDCVKVK